MFYQDGSAFHVKKMKNEIIENQKIKVLITTHCFYDVPHALGELLFPDFYEWLKYLAQISNKTNYDCNPTYIVKFFF